MTNHVTNTNNPIDFPSVTDRLEARLREEDRMIAAKLHAKGWRKRQIENLKTAAELHAGDGGYEEGTQEEYEAFVAMRNQSKFDTLMYEAGLTAQGCWDQMDQYDRAAILKFAELIVRECADVCSNVLDYHGILEKFGIKE